MFSLKLGGLVTSAPGQVHLQRGRLCLRMRKSPPRRPWATVEQSCYLELMESQDTLGHSFELSIDQDGIKVPCLRQLR